MSSPRNVSEKLLDLIVKEADKYVGTAGRRAIANAEEALSSILLGLQRDGKLSSFSVAEMAPIPKRPATSPATSSSAPPNKKNRSATGKESVKQASKPKPEENVFVGNAKNWKGLDMVVTPSRKPVIDPSDFRVIQVPIKQLKGMSTQIDKMLDRTKSIIWVGSAEKKHADEAIKLMAKKSAKKFVILDAATPSEIKKAFTDGGWELKVVAEDVKSTISATREELANAAKAAKANAGKSKEKDTEIPEKNI